MDEIRDYLQRRKLDGATTEITSNESQEQNRPVFHKLALQHLPSFDYDTSKGNDLISYDRNKEDFYEGKEAGDMVNEFESCSRMLKVIKETASANSLQGIGKKLHREALQTLVSECQSTVEDAVHQALEEAQKMKAKAVQDALEEYAHENEEYIMQLKRQHQKDLEEETTRIEKKAKEETEKRIQEEKEAGEHRVKLAMEEAQEHFLEHLKTAVEEAQEVEKRTREDKLAQMKREFEEKAKDLNRSGEEEKQKALLRQQRQLQKEKDKAIEDIKKDEEERTMKELKSQETEYTNVITKLENKLASMDQELHDVAEKLKQSVLQKSKIDAEISRVRGQLEQFFKLAATAGTEITQIPR